MKNLPCLYITLILMFFYSQIKGQEIDSLNYYLNNKEITKAISFGEKHKEVLESNFEQSNSLEFICFLDDLSELYRLKGEYGKVETLYLQSLDIRKTILGEYHPDYIISLKTLISFYDDGFDHSQLDPLYNQLIEIQRKVLGEKNPDYLNSLYELCFYYGSNEKYDKAEPLYLKLVEIYKSIQREKNLVKSVQDVNDNNYENALYELGHCYYNQGKYIQAEPIFKEFLTFLINDYDYASSLKVLGEIYFHQGKFDEAESLLLQSLCIFNSFLAKDRNGIDTEIKRDLYNLYESEKKYEKAEPICVELLSIAKKKLGEKDFDYGIALLNLGNIYFMQKNYEGAEPLFVESLNIVGDKLYKKKETTLKSFQIKFENANSIFFKLERKSKKNLIENYPNYSNALWNLGYYYEKINLHDKAEIFYLKSISIINQTLSDNNIDYAKAINRLGVFYKEQEKYKLAEENFSHSLSITYKVSGKVNPNYTNTLLELADLYKDQGKFRKAESCLLKSLSIENLKNAKPDLFYPRILYDLGNLYKKREMYEEAEFYLSKSLKIRKQLTGDDYFFFGTEMNELKNLFNLQCKYEKADSLNIQSLNLRRNAYEIYDNTYSYDYRNYLYDLGNYYLNKGNAIKAELYFNKSLTVSYNYSSTFDEDSTAFAQSLKRLAIFYREQEKFDKSEELFLQSIAIIKKESGENKYFINDYLINLAILYREQNKYDKSEQLLLESLNNVGNNDENDEANYSTTIFRELAYLYELQGKYEKAESFYLQFVETNKTNLIPSKNDYVSAISELAHFYWRNLKFKKSEPLFLEVLNAKKKTFGENHKDYIHVLKDLALLYQEMGDTINNSKPSIYINLFFKPYQNQILNASSFLTSYEFNSYISNINNDKFIPLSFLNHYPTQYPEINIGCYETELLLKNLLLHNQQRIFKIIQERGDQSLKIKYEKLLSNKRQIIKFTEFPIDKRPKRLEAIIDETETLEKELVANTATLSKVKNISSLNWKDIQKKLKPNEIAIDLVSFEYYDKKWTDSIIYGALIVNKLCKFPKYVSLFEQKQLEILLDRIKNQQINIQIDKQYSDKSISDLFLKPLENELEGITTIYLSLSGLGNQIDFGALPIKDTQTFGEKYKLHILNSPAELIDYKVATLEKKSKIELLLYGGINYTKSNGNSSLNVDDNAISSNEDFINSSKRSGIEALPGTLTEVNSININANKSGFSSKVFKESEATEESIKALDGKKTPYVLHLATHGYFFPDPVQEIQKDIVSSGGKSKIYKTSEDPMMRSGLLLAGAKNYWGKPNQNNTIENGILTASEISNLDLSACQLVVLSACETGLGEVKGSEGVFGLQRAFKMAGVKNIIMSLWKVPDTQTAALFDIFYSECFAGKSIHEAFQSAQAKMKVKYSPYYWAGFVLLE